MRGIKNFSPEERLPSTVASNKTFPPLKAYPTNARNRAHVIPESRRKNICTGTSSLLLPSSGAPYSGNMISLLPYCRRDSGSRESVSNRLLILPWMQTFQLLLGCNPLPRSRASCLPLAFVRRHSIRSLPPSSRRLPRRIYLDFLYRYGGSIYCSGLSLLHRLSPARFGSLDVHRQKGKLL